MELKTNNLKRAVLAFAFILASTTFSVAQCEKPVTLISSLTTYLNAKGEVQRTKDEESVITLSKSEIIIVPGDEEHKMTGVIKSYVCNWSVPFKTGKTVATTVLTDGGREMNATVTIEGKDGKVTLTFEAKEMPDMKIMIVADKFQSL